MSNAVFPLMNRVSLNVKKVPEFSTLVQQATSKRELRASLAAYPIWTFSLNFELLRQYGSYDELREIAGFFLQRRGKYDSFLFTDPADNSVTDEQFGTGDGSDNTFQLTRSFGGFEEPVENPNTVTSIKVNGVTKTLTTDYTVGSTGIITFTSAPANGHAITWTGTYYMRCRFVDDAAEFNQFCKDLFEYKKIELIGAPGNKI